MIPLGWRIRVCDVQFEVFEILDSLNHTKCELYISTCFCIIFVGKYAFPKVNWYQKIINSDSLSYCVYMCFVHVAFNLITVLFVQAYVLWRQTDPMMHEILDS